jgi:hypothetical protein
VYFQPFNTVTATPVFKYLLASVSRLYKVSVTTV